MLDPDNLDLDAILYDMRYAECPEDYYNALHAFQRMQNLDISRYIKRKKYHRNA